MGDKIKMLIEMLNTPDKSKPDIKAKGWRKKNDTMLYTVKKKIKYKITDKLISKMKEYTRIYETIPDVELKQIIKHDKDRIGTIYEIIDKKKKERYVGYTNNSFPTFIKLNLHQKNIGGPNIIEKFKGTDITDLTFKILEYIKYKKRVDIMNRRNYWKKKVHETIGLTKKPGRTPSDKPKNLEKPEAINLDKLFDRRMEVFYEVFKPFEKLFTPFEGYIYIIRNKVTNKEFIGGSEKELTEKEFIKMITECTTSKEFIEDHDFLFALLEKFKCKSIFDFMLRIDYLKIQTGSIQNGYNYSYCMEESPKLFAKEFTTRSKEQVMRTFFVKINKYLFLKKFKDTFDYKNVYGFVYMIENKNNKEKYIGSAFGSTLKAEIDHLYEKALGDNIKFNKVLKLLMDVSVNDLLFKIIKVKEMNDTKINLVTEVKKYIDKYDTINHGYNIDYNSLKKKFIIGKKYQNK